MFRSGGSADRITTDSVCYLIDALWLKRWRQFLLNDCDSYNFSLLMRTVHGTKVSCGHPPPGPITNESLLQGNTSNGNLKPGLRAGKDYRVVNKNCWEHLLRRYGGGPVITSESFSGIL